MFHHAMLTLVPAILAMSVKPVHGAALPDGSYGATRSPSTTTDPNQPQEAPFPLPILKRSVTSPPGGSPFTFTMFVPNENSIPEIPLPSGVRIVAPTGISRAERILSGWQMPNACSFLNFLTTFRSRIVVRINDMRGQCPSAAIQHFLQLGRPNLFVYVGLDQVQENVAGRLTGLPPPPVINPTLADGLASYIQLLMSRRNTQGIAYFIRSAGDVDRHLLRLTWYIGEYVQCPPPAEASASASAAAADVAPVGPPPPLPTLDDDFCRSNTCGLLTSFSRLGGGGGSSS